MLCLCKIFHFFSLSPLAPERYCYFCFEMNFNGLFSLFVGRLCCVLEFVFQAKPFPSTAHRKTTECFKGNFHRLYAELSERYARKKSFETRETKKIDERKKSLANEMEIKSEQTNNRTKNLLALPWTKMKIKTKMRNWMRWKTAAYVCVLTNM